MQFSLSLKAFGYAVPKACQQRVEWDGAGIDGRDGFIIAGEVDRSARANLGLRYLRIECEDSMFVRNVSLGFQPGNRSPLHFEFR